LTPRSPLICSRKRSLAAYEHRGRFRDVGRPGGAWLYGIAAKKLAHFFRRREVEMRVARRLGLERPPLDQESALLIAALIDTDEQRAALRAALEQISGAEREAVELRVISELDYDDGRPPCGDAAQEDDFRVAHH
jgi:DNA-directed RNA polymerase specialized sigma24 family protein